MIEPAWPSMAPVFIAPPSRAPEDTEVDDVDFDAIPVPAKTTDGPYMAAVRLGPPRNTTYRGKAATQ